MSYATESAAVSGNARQVAPHADEKPYGICCASGCVLPGSLSEATQGTVDWYCHLHRGAAYSEHAGISARAANRRKLYLLARRLSNANAGIPVPDAVFNWLRKQDRAEFITLAKPSNDGGYVTARRLGTAMMATLDAECRSPQASIREAKPEASTSTFTPVAAFLEGLL